ncbi:MAG TPA: hypothetical protein VFE47_30650 [Tepidisphaeraceae bacterium]|nr:hypothetical protein [Tepidisphaeraceae bacterium]
MRMDFELLEDRGDFAAAAVAETSRTPGPMRAVSMPLLHETAPNAPSRRQPPAGLEKWVAAEFRVDAPPVKLWASESAMDRG